MKILITNDDGIDSPGLSALADAAAAFGEVIVAPTACRSSCGHQVTTDRALRLEQRAPQRYALDGSPADCVRLALLELAPDTAWVLSGINHGANLGVDVLMSGTVAAVREAALLGRQAIALSQYLRNMQPREWHHAGRVARQIFEQLLAEELPTGAFWNVNLPDPLEEAEPLRLMHCDLDPHPLPVAYASLPESSYRFAGRYHDRPRNPGSDVDVCFSGKVAVSRLKVFSSF